MRKLFSLDDGTFPSEEHDRLPKNSGESGLFFVIIACFLIELTYGLRNGNLLSLIALGHRSFLSLIVKVAFEFISGRPSIAVMWTLMVAYKALDDYLGRTKVPRYEEKRRRSRKRRR